ncbi:MAG TPA: amidophosphoribosyltransferase [Gemmatimonadota bacterium]|nr:amidophosphoribosyltransferase [Gemmatimonadota bacterium]
MSGPRDECGIVGVIGRPRAADWAVLGLYALQHRGQESSGIVSVREGRAHVVRGMGLVAEVFGGDALERLPGSAAIGHNRYSTTGSSTPVNAQPLLVNYRDGFLAVSHNGNLVNARTLRRRLESAGSIFQSTMDTEVLVHLIAASREPNRDRAVLHGLEQIEGAYSFLILTPDALYAARDPHGFRPLSLGRSDGAVVLASETCALDLLGIEAEREVGPGEVLKVTEGGRIELLRDQPAESECMCVFEQIYFARPDSVLFGMSAADARRRMGRELAREHPAAADCVFSVPDSSNAAAAGYAEETGLPLEHGLIRNHYIGRTFIQPGQDVRDFRVRIKYNPVTSVIRGRRVVVVDDSIVRGTTSGALVRVIREAGAREVHLRIASPPLRHPCYYGIDIPKRDELIAANLTIPEIAEHAGADSLAYLSFEGLYRAVGDRERHCDACFSGNYRVPVEAGIEEKTAFEPSALLSSAGPKPPGG